MTLGCVEKRSRKQGLGAMKGKGKLDVVVVFWGFSYLLGCSLWLHWGLCG